MPEVKTKEEIANKWQMNRYRTPGQEGGMDNHEFYHLLQDDVAQYAEQEAIAFSEWIRYSGVFNGTHKKWEYGGAIYTTTELYNIYKQQNVK